ncbi:16S rRNA m(7)G-527 methyltransferase [Hydrogenispora ethanolica]|uniref:Ribosomal RNA small subunit methyltransferase G n=1 Tax=Hydrogenispora ethanolica TaxID=1082276 RepID=A0A4R1SA02_HYDET|nr:16S rRNA (guanine(527)-N(7))-methyltransferase RsmG [Hydrogenispora ethanolica]TCL76325.1 16S rRNA m(7)G-527 methyltransferase [Hydrogenispora ethanolica]
MSHLRRDELEILFRQAGLELSDSAHERLVQFLELVIHTNEQLNLTAITSLEEGYVKHLYDSLAIIGLPEFARADTLIDIGSGAGFPSIPLAICFPGKRFTSLDSTQKKINFQAQAAELLGLQNFTTCWGRAEELAHSPAYRESFDLATARAVAQVNILLELALPFVKTGSAAVFYKGKDYLSELESLQKPLAVLHAGLDRAISYHLPDNLGERAFVVFQKQQPTASAYPRKPGVPQKKPL